MAVANETKAVINEIMTILFNDNDDSEEINPSTLRCAYSIVLADLMNKSPLLTGKYDAENGKESFMYGIATVMEYIAGGTGNENLLNKFEDMFYNNLVLSEIKAKVKEKEEPDILIAFER